LALIAKMECVTKRYNSGGRMVVPVENMSLEIQSGTTVLIQGPSGCGKTTLLNLIGCLTRPTSGKIWIKDREITRLTDQFLTRIRRNQIGFIFQQYNLLAGFSALQNICIPLVPCGIPRQEREKRAGRMLEILDVSHRADFPVNSLSGGEQQRIAIARALVNDPELILADEPTSNVDEQTGKKIIDLFHVLRSQGKTIVVASHDRYLTESLRMQLIVSLDDLKKNQAVCDNCDLSHTT